MGIADTGGISGCMHIASCRVEMYVTDTGSISGEMHGSPIGDRGTKTQAVFWVHAKPTSDAVNISDCKHI